MEGGGGGGREKGSGVPDLTADDKQKGRVWGWGRGGGGVRGREKGSGVVTTESHRSSPREKREIRTTLQDSE